MWTARVGTGAFARPAECNEARLTTGLASRQRARPEPPTTLAIPPLPCMS
jgi:hypothetical protein